MTYPSYLIERTQKLKVWLQKEGHAGCLIQDAHNLFYYTGLHLSAGILFFTLEKQILIADYRYAERCKEFAPFEVLATKSYKEALQKISFPKEMVVDGEIMTLEEAKGYSKWAKLKSIPGFLGQLRRVKDGEEIQRITKSCEMTAKGYDYIEQYLEEGVTEQEIAMKLEFYLRSLGAEKMAFDPIVAFGKNSANPHYSPQNVKLKKNDVVLIDSGSLYKGYCSDMTRTYLIGKVPPRMKEIYDLVAHIQSKAVDMCEVGTPLKSISDAVHTFFKEQGVDELFIHSLGHSMGIEIHEAPRFDVLDKIEPGMVLTVEPGLYIHNLGGVRIEDSILMTEKGPKNLTRK